jgi:glycerol-3-phosphate acyltransferase PlsX
MIPSSVPEARIAVDAMGGDLGPGEVAAAAAIALEQDPGLELTLIGRPDELGRAVASSRLTGHRAIRLVYAEEVITMDDKPLQAIKRKKDASMVRAVELVKTGEVGAVVSCGNTGALMALGTLRLRTMDGVDRPALATVIPHAHGHFVLLDAGANPDARPEHMVHNAVLGTDYCRVVLGIPRPRVGLLTIGTEEGKGNELINDTHELLKRIDGVINYRGLIEGFHVFDDEVDVIVCDGFTGNVVLKTCESLFVHLKDTMKQELMSSWLRKFGALCARGAFVSLKKKFTPERYGGAPLLGLRGHVIKAHGSSNRHAIASAILTGARMLETNMESRTAASIAKANGIVQALV